MKNKMKNKKEKYQPVFDLIERMRKNGQLKINSEIEMRPNGDTKIDCEFNDTAMAIHLLHAFMEANHNSDFRETFDSTCPLDEHDNPISFHSFYSSLLFMSNLYAQRALALNENIKSDLN